MKALVIHPYMHILGGGERVCLHIVRALIEEGHDVALVSEPVKLDKLGETSGLDAIRNVTWFPYETFEPKIKKFTGYQMILHHKSLKDKFKNKISTVDLEILTQDARFLYDVGKKKAAYVHYPTKERLVHLEGASPRTRHVWKLYYLPVLWYWRRQIDKIDLFLCNSEYTKKAIMERWGKEAEVVYPPVDVEKIGPAAKEEFVVTVGRFVEDKNYEMVVEVAKSIPEVKFVIIGRKEDKEYYEKIKRLKPDNVTLLTDLSQKELFSMLARAKVYLHTMIGEHFGISVVEAMAAGCVPVVHNSGGAREAIGNIGYAYNNVKECSEHIRQALSMDIDVSQIVENAKKFTSENFRDRVKEKLREKGFL